jgi:hypothetical protein
MHKELRTYLRGQNDGRRGIVQLCDIKGLRDEVRWVELVKLDIALGLRRRLRLGWGHVVRFAHTHSAELLGHLRNIVCGSSVAGGGRLHLTWVGAVGRLLISRSLRLLGISTEGASGSGLTSERRIGTRTKLKGLTCVCSLLLSCGASRRRSLRGDGRLLLLCGIRGDIAGLGVPLLGRVTPLWSCHEDLLEVEISQGEFVHGIGESG